MTHNNINSLSEVEKVFVNMIISKVCQLCSVTFEEIHETDKQKKHLFPRRLICALLYSKTNIPLTDLQKVISRDHSTIIYSYQEHIQILETDETYLSRTDGEYRVLALKAKEILQGCVCLSHGKDTQRKYAQAKEVNESKHLINYEFVYEVLKLHSIYLGHLNNVHKIDQFIRDCPLLQKPHNIVVGNE